MEMLNATQKNPQQYKIFPDAEGRAVLDSDNSNSASTSDCFVSLPVEHEGKPGLLAVSYEGLKQVLDEVGQGKPVDEASLVRKLSEVSGYAATEVCYLAMPMALSGVSTWGFKQTFESTPEGINVKLEPEATPTERRLEFGDAATRTVLTDQDGILHWVFPGEPVDPKTVTGVFISAPLF